MNSYLLVAVGAGAGAPLRFLIDRTVTRLVRHNLPWGTFSVNMVGSIILGALSGALMAGPELALLIGTGFCGALTTYSTFSYESAVLWERGRRSAAMMNIVGSVVVGLGAAVAGFAVGSAFWG